MSWGWPGPGKREPRNAWGLTRYEELLEWQRLLRQERRKRRELAAKEESDG